jgi:hypothetical protein
VPGAAVSFHLPEDGPSGTFANGLRTDVATTDERGRATLRSLQLNRTPGRLQIRIIASKEQAKAGIVSFQYIADPNSGAATANAGNSSERSIFQVSKGSHGHKKLFLILAAVGGGAAAFLATRAGSSGSSSSSSGSSSNGDTPVVTTIGTPTITVGKP